MDDMIMNKVPSVSVRTRHHTDWHIRLTRGISDPDDFAEELQALASVQEGDNVAMDIISPGGSMDTCIMMRRAIMDCNAPVVGWIGPTCASAGTAIALACHGWEVDETSSFMIHTASFSPGYGKARDVEAATLHNVKLIEVFVRSVYTGFLTEEEILKVLDGKEMYFLGEELAERLQAYDNYRRNLIDEAMQEE